MTRERERKKINNNAQQTTKQIRELYTLICYITQACCYFVIIIRRSTALEWMEMSFKTYKCNAPPNERAFVCAICLYPISRRVRCHRLNLRKYISVRRTQNTNENGFIARTSYTQNLSEISTIFFSLFSELHFWASLKFIDSTFETIHSSCFLPLLLLLSFAWNCVLATYLDIFATKSIIWHLHWKLMKSCFFFSVGQFVRSNVEFFRFDVFSTGWHLFRSHKRLKKNISFRLFSIFIYICFFFVA